jgi:hypothetical protein
MAAPTYSNGSWWYNGVAYATEQAANDAASGVNVGDPSSDFNSDAINAIPTVRAPVDTGQLAASRARRAEIERLSAVPYGTPQSAGGTATEWQSQTYAPTSFAGASIPGGVVSRPLDAQGNPLSLAVSENTTGPNKGAGSYSATVAIPGGGAQPVGSAGAPSNLAPLTGDARTTYQSMVANTGATQSLRDRAANNAGPAPATNAFSSVPGVSGTGAGGAPGGGAPAANTSAADDARALNDTLIAQLQQQAGKAQAAPAVDTTGYNATRAQGNATFNSLQAQANNNISPTTGQANANQRDLTQGSLLNTAQSLTGNATRSIAPVTADPSQRNASGASLSDLIAQLSAQQSNNVGDIQVNGGQYNQGRDVTSDIIQRLLAEAQRPEGPSAAEALMLQGQERAERNAMGDALTTAGGFRSQLTNMRRAEGLGAQMSADAAAQSAALRANEETQYRADVRNALLGAGGLQSDVSGRDLALGTTNASLLAQTRQGNQANAREALTAAGQTQLGQLTSDTGFATSNADRDADIAKANAVNRLNSLLGAGNLQSSALTSDTSLAQSNASNALDAAKSNQSNSLASQVAASQNAQARLESDRALATANADRAERVSQNNAQNSLQALQAAGVINNGTRQGDIQLSQGDQRAVVDMAIAAAQIDAQKYGAQLQYAIGMANVEARKAELQRLYDTDPTTVEKFLGAIGPVASTLGLLGWKPMGGGTPTK